mgnify:CR=1 FL=1
MPRNLPGKEDQSASQTRRLGTTPWRHAVCALRSLARSASMHPRVTHPAIYNHGHLDYLELDLRVKIRGIDCDQNRLHVQ